MAATRRVRTRAREMRQAPITMKTVRTSGNSSGSIDMPSAMPLSSASSQPPRQRPYSNTGERAEAEADGGKIADQAPRLHAQPRRLGIDAA